MRKTLGTLLVAASVLAPAVATAAPATLWVSRPFDDEPLVPPGPYTTHPSVFMTPNVQYTMYATSDPATLGSPGGRRIVVHNNFTGATEVMTRQGLEPPPVATETFDMEPGGISADGKRVVFVAPAESAIAPVPPGTTGRQAFLYDRDSDKITMVGAAPSNTAPNGETGEVTISDDGGFVAFSSTADNLTQNADGPYADAYVYTVATGEIRLASRVFDPGPGQEPYRHTQVAISGEGAFVVYTRSDGQETTSQVFRRDMINGSIQQVSVNASGLTASAPSRNPSISVNGQYVSFTTPATNIDRRAQGNEAYVRDIDNQTTQFVREFEPTGPRPPVVGHPQLAPARYLSFQVAAGTESATTWVRHLSAPEPSVRVDVPEGAGTPDAGLSVPGKVGVTPQGEAAIVSTGTGLAPYAGPDNDAGSPDAFVRLDIGLPPVSKSPPVITDRSNEATPAAACAVGGWEEHPERFRYQWLRRPAGSQVTPTELPGETRRTHNLVADDQRQELLCRVTATNVAGQAQATSGPLAINFLAPQNKVPPSILGVPRAGMTLRCDRGQWETANGAPFVLAHRWTRDGGPLQGVEDRDYTVTNDDLDHELRCSVTATAALGSEIKDSAPVVPATGPPLFDPGDPVTGRAPGTPTLQGAPVYGTDVGCGQMALPSPRVLQVRYAWLLDGVVIAGQTRSSVRVSETLGAPLEPAGRALQCRVTLVNDLGETTLTSPAKRIVRGVPVNQLPPTISATTGATPLDRVLTCAPGTWSEDVEATTEYAWQREGVLIEGVTSQRYKVTVDDLGRDMRCVVTKTNAAGAGKPASAATRVPLPAANGGTRVMQHLGVNQYDPSNFMAITDRTTRDFDGLSRAYYVRQVDAYRTECRINPPAATEPVRAPTCAILTDTSTDQLTLTLGSVFYDGASRGPCVSTGDPDCVRLPIDFRAPGPDDLAAIGAAEDVGSQPVLYLWDLDGNNRVDVACPASAPVARLLYTSGDWRMRVTVVQADSFQTGIFPTADFAVNIDGDLRSAPLHASRSELVALSESRGAARMRQAVAMLPPAAKLFPPPVGPGTRLTPRLLRANQPIACKTSLTPPPPKTNLPCVTNAQVGRVALEGNMCPISLRQMPQNEIDALPDDVRNVLNDRAFKEEADAVNNRWAPWLRTRQAAAFGSPRIDRAVTYARNFDDFTTHVARSFALRPKTIDLIRKTRAPLSTETAAFSLDQIYLAQPPSTGVAGRPAGYGALKVNGVSIMPRDGASVLIVPSDSQDSIIDTGDAAINRAAAERGITDAAGKALLKNTAVDAKNALAKLTISSSKSVQALVDGPIPIPLSSETPGEFEAANINDARTSAASQVLAQLPNLPGKLDLGPFDAVGSFKASLAADNTVTLETRAKFPDIFRDAKGQSPTFDVTLRGTPQGSFTLEDLKIDVPGTVSILVLEAVGVKIAYSPREDLLELQGKLRLLPPAGPTIAINDFRLKDGKLEALDIDYVGPPGIPIFPGVFITRIGGGYRDDGKVAYLRGGAEVAVGPGGSGCTALGLRGDFTTKYAPKTVINIRAGLTVICIPLVDVDVTINGDGYVEMGVGIDYTLGPAYLKGSIRGDIQAPSRLDAADLRWQVEAPMEGGIKIPVLGTVKADIHALASDSGVGACGRLDLVVTSIAGGAGLRFARANRYPTSLDALISGLDTFSGCDISRYSKGRATRLATDGARVTELPRDGEFAIVSVEGVGGAPAVALVDSTGKVIADGTTGEGKLSKAGSAIRIENESKTVFVVPAKRGDFTVRPTDGSVPIFGVTTASVLPKAKVTARVTGRGAQRVLSYDIAELPGQTVRFVEQAQGAGQDIGKVVSGGGRGKLPFTVAESEGAKRTIVAQVAQDGMPRDNITVERFVQASPKVGAPRRVKLRRKETKLDVAFKRGVLAEETLLVLRLPGGLVRTATVYAGERQRATFRGVPRTARGKLTLTSVSGLGKLSRPAVVSVRPSKPKRGK